MQNLYILMQYSLQEICKNTPSKLYITRKSHTAKETETLQFNIQKVKD